LNCSANKLTTLPGGTFKHLINLKQLSLEKNLIKQIDKDTFEGLNNLAILELSYNKLEHLPENVFKNLKLLQGLYMQENYFRVLSDQTFFGLASLKTLYLEKNRLKFIQSDLFKNLKSLQLLNIRNNPLKIIDDNTFSDLVNLEKLYISGIPFYTLPDGLFKNNTNLEFVDLSSAKITRISNKQFSHIKTLKLIDFEDSFCANIKFHQHNSSVLFTEDMLLPCSCLTSDKTRRESNFSIYFVIGTTVTVLMVAFTCKYGSCFMRNYRCRRFRKSKLYSFAQHSKITTVCIF
jgi:Leucine-rich repeat (LRR) protein